MAWRKAQDQPTELRIARWCVAKCLRALGRVEEALVIHQTLHGAAPGEADGFILEELGECLLTLRRPEEAREWFVRAYQALSTDQYLVNSEPERLRRLAQLAGSDSRVSG